MTKLGLILLTILSSVTSVTGCKHENKISPDKEQKDTASKKYNVLFIAIDDLNDYVSVLRNFPNVKMPNIDQFAKNAITFTHAYASAPVCNPSRISVLTGLKPIRTGCMNNGNGDWFQNSQEAVEATLLPEIFHRNGYTTMWSGKIFHTGGH